MHIKKSAWSMAAFFLCLALCFFGGSGLTASAAGIAPKMALTSPASSTISIYAGQSLDISGWAVNPSGINRIDVWLRDDNDTRPLFTDNSLDANSSVQSSQDPSGAYTDSLHNSFSGTVKANALSAGTHTVGIAAIGNNGSVEWSYLTVKVTVPEPKTTLNCSSTISAYTGKDVGISGSAVTPSGINRVDVWLRDANDTRPLFTDNSLSADSSAKASLDPGGVYGNSLYNSFSGTIKAGSLSAGTHSVGIAVIGNDGTVQWTFVTVNVTRPTAKIAVQSPSSTSSAYTSAGLDINGWAMNPSGINRIDVWLRDDNDTRPLFTDNSLDANSSVQSQQDSSGVYSDSLHNSFSGTVEANTLSEGTHTIGVAAIGNDGSVEWSYLTVKESKPAPKTTLSCSSTIYGYTGKDISISGSAVNASGINRIDVWLRDDNDTRPLFTDNSLSADSSAQSSLDPNGIYTNSLDNSFSGNVRAGSLSAGTHTVGVAAIGNDGTVQWTYITVKVTRPDSKMALTSPASSTVTTNFTKDIAVNGWAVNASGINRIDVWLLDDGNTKPLFTDNSLDADSATQSSVDPNGIYANSGNNHFSGTIKAGALNNGTHQVGVAAIGNDGTVQWSYLTINITSVKESVSYNISLSKLASLNSMTTTSLDPTSIINSSSCGIYEFMSLRWVDGVTTQEMDSMLKGCGILDGMGYAFMEAGQKYNLNPVYLAAHAILETGYGTSNLANGEDSQGNFFGYYNMYGYGAYDEAAIEGGNSTAQKYDWDTPEKAIIGGAYEIAYNYVNGDTMHGGYAQKTLYEMKWDPYGSSKSGKKGFEYATDPGWAYKISNIISRYSSIFDDSGLTFYIPQYTN